MIKLSLLKNCSSVLSSTENLPPALNFCTDTRSYSHPSAFVAIPGQKINPLQKLQSLLDQECPVVFFQNFEENAKIVSELSETYKNTSFVPVSDSILFLQEITHEHIKEWKLKSGKNTVFAISGSNGKTTHKEMLAHILSTVLPGKVVATEKNNNNHLGVPLTLLNVSDETEVIVLELGSNHPGEIKFLCEISAANAGITTNIGETHLEFFGCEEKVFEEEAYLYHAIKDLTHGQGFYLINIDDKFLKHLPKTPGSVTYGESGDAEARVKVLDDGASIQYKGVELVAHNPHITGKHNKLNLITCLFIAHHFYPKLKQEFTKACETFIPTKNRSEWIEFEGRTIFLDAYNANPSSMKAALHGFKESVLDQGFKLDDACIVLGDMNELGDSTPHYHKDVGHFVEELGFTHVYYVGQYSKHYLEGNSRAQGRSSSSEFKSEYRNECLKKFPIHFIKGSRSLQLESLFDIS